MQPDNLKRRFVGALHQVRGRLQQNLSDYFVSNPVVAADFVAALGLGKPREVQAAPQCPWYLSDEKKPDSDWEFLPQIFPDEPREKLLVYPANRDSRGRIDCEIAAAAFGLWMFSYDPAQGTFYYPFTDSNFVFGHTRPPHIMQPKEEYKRFLGRVLGDYRLMIGEGSHGVAARGARGCLLQDTFVDVRGAVALEDFILRNFTYLAFPLKSESERFQGAPFAYVALIYPVPMAGDPNSLRRVYRFLKRDFVDAAASIMEPVACHLQDVLLLQKQRHIMTGLSDLALAGRFKDVCHNFAVQVARPLSEYQDLGLRDPFAFSGIHVVPPSDVRGDRAIRCYNPNVDTVSVMLRGCFEQCLEPDLLTSEPSTDPVADRILEKAAKVLHMNDEEGGAEDSSRLELKELKVHLEPSSGFGPQQVSLAVLWKVPAYAAEKSENRRKEETGLGKKTDGAIRTLLESVIDDWDDRIRCVRDWIGPSASEEGDGSFWDPFNDMITSRKTLEMLFHIVGRSLCAFITGGAKAAAQKDEHLADVDYLEVLMRSGGELVRKHLDECFHEMARVSDDDRQAGEVVAATLWVGEECGVRGSLAHRDIARHEEGTLFSSLESYPVRRVLATLPGHFDRYFDECDRRELGPRDLEEGKSLGRVTEIRLTPWSHEDADFLEAPVSGRFGEDSSGLFNHSLMTTLSDPHRWESAAAVFDSLYVIRFPDKESGEKRIFLALGGSGEEQLLTERIRKFSQHTPEDVVRWPKGSEPWLCMEWSIQGDALNYGSAAWSVNRRVLSSLVPLTSIVKPDPQVLAPIRTQLSTCLAGLRDGAGGADQEEPPRGEARFCFPELIFRDNRNIAPLIAPSAQSLCHYRDKKGKRWNACRYGKENCDSAVSLAALLGFDSDEDRPGRAAARSFFHPSLGARRHLVWPISTPEDTEPDKLGFFLLTTYVSPLADPVQDEKCPIVLGDAHHELLKTAVDHIGFVLQQERWAEEKLRSSRQFVHNSKTDWNRARRFFPDNAEAQNFLANIDSKLLADLDNYNDRPERSAWVVESPEQLRLLLKSRFNETIAGLWSMFKKCDKFSGKRPREIVDVSGLADSDACFPLYLPRYTLVRTIDELVENAFKYSAAPDDGKRAIIALDCGYDANGSGMFSLKFTNTSGGLPVRRHAAKKHSSGCGLKALERTLRINMKESSRFDVPSIDELSESGNEVSFTVAFNPEEVRDSLLKSDDVVVFDYMNNELRRRNE